MIVNLIMSEPMKNHESQHQKVEKNLQNQFSEQKETRLKEFCAASRMVIELAIAHYLKSEKYHFIICELSESKNMR